MKIKIKKGANTIYREAMPKDEFSWKYYHILTALDGREIDVEEEEGRLFAPPMQKVSVMPFEIHQDVFEKIIQEEEEV